MAPSKTMLRRSLTCGDNLAIMQSLQSDCCDLIYVDPPFLSQTNGDPGPNWHVNGVLNEKTIEAHTTFLKPRLEQMHRLLSERGSLYVHLDWRTVHYVKVLLDRIFGHENFLNEIIWAYRTGGVSKRWFSRKHDTILLYARCKGRHTFNVQRGGQFRTDGLNTDDQGRQFKNTKNGRLYFHDDGPVLTDVWEIPFLSTVSSERTGYPSQKPEALLERIIRASSNPGDLVADFFCGSGTTPVVAARLERDWLATDIAQGAIDIATWRVRETRSG